MSITKAKELGLDTTTLPFLSTPFVTAGAQTVRHPAEKQYWVVQGIGLSLIVSGVAVATIATVLSAPWSFGAEGILVYLVLLVLPAGFAALAFLRHSMPAGILLALLNGLVTLLVINGAELTMFLFTALAPVATFGGVKVLLENLYSKPRSQHIPGHMPPDGVRIRGAVANISGSVHVFGAGAVAAGAKGEQATADMLELLLHIPGTIIYHGLRFPKSRNADVDHAVVFGSNVVLIDSKQFRAGTYTWYDQNKILGPNDSVFDNYMGEARDGYEAILNKDRLTRVKTYASIVVHGENVQVPFAKSQNDVTMSNAQDFVRSLGQLLSANAALSLYDHQLNELLVANLIPKNVTRAPLPARPTIPTP